MGKKIAIIGSRGMPAKYGGFETFTEEISTRLVSKGYDVYVSCEGGVTPQIPEYKGVKLFYFPLKPFFRIIYETIYDIYSMIKASKPCDCIYVLGYGAGFFFFIPKMFGKKLIVNVDGREWKRDKYNKLEKLILYLSEKSAVWYSNIVVADAYAIQNLMTEKNTNKRIVFIPYGVEAPPIEDWNSKKLNDITVDNDEFYKLKANEYDLVVARLEPENNIYSIIEGFIKSNTNKKLVIIGNYNSNSYKARIDSIIKKYNAYDRIIFTGSIYRKDVLNMLRQNCHIYIHGHSAGGTNPSLLEAMISRAIIFAHDNEFNREVGGKCILYFKNVDDLSNKLTLVDNNVGQYLKLKYTAYIRVKNNYSWNDIANKYDKLFNSM